MSYHHVSDSEETLSALFSVCDEVTIELVAHGSESYTCNGFSILVTDVEDAKRKLKLTMKFCPNCGEPNHFGMHAVVRGFTVFRRFRSKLVY
jgi:hypothetical protein